MSPPRTVPSRGDKDIVSFSLLFNGAELARSWEVAGISTFSGVAKIPYARIELFDGDPAAETFTASEDATFAPGAEVEIRLGYSSEVDPVFKGILIGQKIRVRQNGRNLLTLVCRHPLFKSTLTLKSKNYTEITDSAAIQELLSPYVSSVDVDDVSFTHESLLRDRQTDWDFALARARANGLLLIPTLDGVEAKKPALDAEPTLNLQFGATILELDAEFDIRSQPTEVQASSWDPSTQELLDTTGEEPAPIDPEAPSPSDWADIHGQDELHRFHRAATQEELDGLATAKLELQRLGSRSGRVQCVGAIDAVPGAILEISGVGAVFNGKALISAVKHTAREGQWITDIQFGAIPNLEERPPAPSFDSKTSGLYIGVVEALSDDPKEEFRVQISLPTFGPDARPVWARVKSWDAGDNRGAYFFPSLNDEVIVGFINNDPSDPIILGALYSSAHPAPLTPNDDNFEKGYFSASEMRLLFDDDKKIITIDTPAGNKIQLSEEDSSLLLEDQNNNRVQLNTDGALIDCASNIQLKATGDVTIEGVNINLSASGSLKAEGGASAELSASGSATIKGAVVMIN